MSECKCGFKILVSTLAKNGILAPGWSAGATETTVVKLSLVTATGAGMIHRSDNTGRKNWSLVLLEGLPWFV